MTTEVPPATHSKEATTLKRKAAAEDSATSNPQPKKRKNNKGVADSAPKPVPNDAEQHTPTDVTSVPVKPKKKRAAKNAADVANNIPTSILPKDATIAQPGVAEPAPNPVPNHDVVQPIPSEVISVPAKPKKKKTVKSVAEVANDITTSALPKNTTTAKPSAPPLIHEETTVGKPAVPQLLTAAPVTAMKPVAAKVDTSSSTKKVDATPAESSNTPQASAPAEKAAKPRKKKNDVPDKTTSTNEKTGGV